MIIVRLMGGLGNQMFQYAAGRRLAHVRGSVLKLDLDWFNERAATDTVRAYELAAFNVRPIVATAGEIAMYRKSPHLTQVMRYISRVIPGIQQRHIMEKGFGFDPEILLLSDHVYLDGYWQSPRYFTDIDDVIRREFSVRSEPYALNRQFADSIINTESVAVHIRRGDYVTDPKTSRHHGTCTIDYYRGAAAMIASRVPKPHFYLFSDDPAWTKDNLSEIQPMTIIEHNGPDKAYEDLRLMSLCKYHIIANSSFSWWGAWLAGCSRKIVVAPRRWFADQRIKTDDLIPEHWIRM